MLKITAFIEFHPGCGYIAYTEVFKGLVVQGDTLKQTKEELHKSILTKIAYDYQLEIFWPSYFTP